MTLYFRKLLTVKFLHSEGEKHRREFGKKYCTPGFYISDLSIASLISSRDVVLEVDKTKFKYKRGLT
jgi:hypothetical protein